MSGQNPQRQQEARQHRAPIVVAEEEIRQSPERHSYGYHRQLRKGEASSDEGCETAASPEAQPDGPVMACNGERRTQVPLRNR